MFEKRTVTLTTCEKLLPPALRIAPMFLRAWCVCSSTVSPTKFPVDGSQPSCPETKRSDLKSVRATAWEYGPIACGASLVEIVVLIFLWNDWMYNAVCFGTCIIDVCREICF